MFNKINIYRDVTEAECQQLFKFYDDDRNGFLTPNEMNDVVWDIYSN